MREKARNYVVAALGFNAEGVALPERFAEIRDLLEYLDLAWRAEPKRVLSEDVRVGDPNPGGFHPKP